MIVFDIGSFLGIFFIFLMYLRYSVKSYAENSVFANWQKLSELAFDKSCMIFICILVFVRIFVGEGYIIPSGSMKPNFYEGDFVLVDKISYNLPIPFTTKKLKYHKEPSIGDAVVFYFPGNKSGFFPKLMIKRLYAKSGDRVVIDSNNNVFVNGTLINKSHIDYFIDNGSDNINQLIKQELGDKQINILHAKNAYSKEVDIVVPEDSYFVLGDNFHHSNDSRYWGVVPKELFVGRAFGVLASFNIYELKFRFDRFMLFFDVNVIHRICTFLAAFALLYVLFIGDLCYFFYNKFRREYAK